MKNYVPEPSTAASLQQAQSLLSPYQPSIRERYAAQLKDSRERVAALEELLMLFERNPDLQRAMEIMGRF